MKITRTGKGEVSMGRSMGGTAHPPYVGPWDYDALQQQPDVEWGEAAQHDGYSLQPLYYNGEPYNGAPSRVFAYCALPHPVAHPMPAVVLVHGGAGQAFSAWAAQWALRGYVAIAMDLFGNGPAGNKLSDGGPGLHVFNMAAQVHNMWEYHAVANVVRAISLLANRNEVDEAAIGIMGISWGGYVTDIVSSFDDRLAYAISIYAAGQLATGSCWIEELGKLEPHDLHMWEEQFDSSSYAGQSSLPMLRATGTNDEAFYLGNWQEACQAARGELTLRLMNNWEHGYAAPWGATEFIAYADAITKGAEPLLAIRHTAIIAGVAGASYSGTRRLKQAWFVYTLDRTAWPARRWHEVEAMVSAAEQRVTYQLPAGTTACFFTFEDDSGYWVSSELLTDDMFNFV